MEVSFKDELYDRLSRYLVGQLDLADFHNWLVPAAWDIDTQPEKVKRIANRAQLLLAEFSNGDRSEEELRSAFWDLLDRRSITVLVGYHPPVIRPTAATRVAAVGTAKVVRSVGTLHATALG